MKYYKLILFCLISLTGCVSQFVPEVHENEELLVVEGLITDQPVQNIISIYKTLPIWTSDFRSKLEECAVWITDDLGTIHHLAELAVGTYATDPATFIGVPGRTYTLHFTAKSHGALYNYESDPMVMIPVPPIDSIYYEKRNFLYQNIPTEGCQIFMETHDPVDSCRFYRWNYKETWEFRLPFYQVRNRICWASEQSEKIMIKNTTLLSENKISRYPMKLIENPVDRLDIKYSILIDQYSINQDEYQYWERLQTSVDQVGGLYDIIPSTIVGNIFCLEDNKEKVLGFFSVSAVKSKRLFIKNDFAERNMLYVNCITGSTSNFDSLPGVPDVNFWILYNYSDSIPPSYIYTSKRECGDCTSRGTITRPDFWDDDK